MREFKRKPVRLMKENRHSLLARKRGQRADYSHERVAAYGKTMVIFL
jgi:hypothetical protein